MVEPNPQKFLSPKQPRTEESWIASLMRLQILSSIRLLEAANNAVIVLRDKSAAKASVSFRLSLYIVVTKTTAPRGLLVTTIAVILVPADYANAAIPTATVIRDWPVKTVTAHARHSQCIAASARDALLVRPVIHNAVAHRPVVAKAQPVPQLVIV